MLRSNLRQLCEAREAREVTIREVARSIDYRFESVRQLYNDEMERYPRELLSRLCAYFNVGLSELFTLDET